MPTQKERLDAIEWIDAALDEVNTLLDEGVNVTPQMIDARLALYAKQGWKSAEEGERRLAILNRVLNDELGGLIATRIDGGWTITTREAAKQMGAI